MERIGFIGASGLMGHGIARNLQAKGHPLSITVRKQRDRVADLLAAGATECASPKALAEASDIVFLCVTGSPQVEELMGGADGVLAGARAGLVIVDTSTSEPDSTARLRAAAAAQGVSFIDAPLARPWDTDLPVYLCREPLSALESFWPELQRFDHRLVPRD